MSGRVDDAHAAALVTIELSLPVVCDGVRLNAGAVAPEDPIGTAVLIHGIPTVTPDPDDPSYPGLARDFAEAGWTGVWANLRGAYGSGGYFSIEGWVRDIRAVVDAARTLEDAQGRPLVLLGSSAGGAASAEAVRQGAHVDALILLAAPASWSSIEADPTAGLQRIVRDAGMEVGPDAQKDPSAWADEFKRVETQTSIAGVRVPTLIVHGTADDVVPVGHAERIAERANRAELRIIEGAGHTLRRDPRVIEEVLHWLKTVTR